VRSCLSRVKSGNLALLSRRATIISLIISDVINDPLEIISSGPTCPSFFTLTNQDRIGNAMSIIHKYRLENEIPQTVMNFFIKQQQKEEFSKHSSSPLVYNYLIFNNRQATDMIMSEANSIGYDYKKVLTNSLCGEAKIVGFAFACLAYSLALGRNYIDIPNLIEFVRKLLFENEEYSKLMDSNELKQCMDTLEILLSNY
jgi:glycerate 2-kinase